MKVSGLLAAIGVAVVIGVGPAPSASAHSGGLDSHGCHAGSQPYHCHNGGSGGSSGGSSGDSSGGSSTSSSSGSSSSVPTGPSPAKLAAIDNAESAVDRSRRELAESRRRFEAVSDKLSVASEKLDSQRDDVEKLRAKIADLEDDADRVREERLEQREAAAKRIRLVAASNRDLLETHKADRRMYGYTAGLFGGFLLIGFVRRLAALLTVARPLALLGGLVASIVLGAIGSALSWAPGGILVSLVGGSLLAGVFMLARVWWVGFRLPKVIGFSLLGLAALIAIGGLASAMSATPPAAEKPASEDVAMVAEQEADPAAEKYEPALEIQEEADALEAEVAALDEPLATQQARIDSLSAKLDTMEAEVATDQAEVAEAKELLETLR